MTKIVFLILPRTHLLDLAGPDQAFLEAREFGADLEVVYCSVEKEIATSSGLSIGKLPHFSSVDIHRGDYLIIPGAEVSFLLSRTLPFEREAGKWIRQAHQAGATICSICTGAFFLARIGMLDGRKCTTHWKRTADLKQRFPLVNLVNDILFTEDDAVMTSAGVTAGIDLALHIIAQLTDDNFSFRVARELVVYTRRKGTEQQQSIFMNYRNHIHSGVHKVQDHIQENIHEKLSLFSLADQACMSARNLTRIFKKETGVTINEYVSLIRKENLRRLLENPDLTRKQMASLCGLKSERQVIRLINAIV